ncbi:MAG TPA: VIT domain-containing protein [Anaerolineae bacterium]|nr:VIT domain-containing protein [Anaerolineae bacterium]
MFNPRAYENSRPGGIGVLEVVDGREAKEGRPRQFVPLRRTELRGEIAGPLASLDLTQVYGYSREECQKVLEVLYRFPMPGDAAITGVRVRFGDVEIRADLKEREEATAAYEEARRLGRQAALATRESPDVFTLQIAGIQPDQDVAVETSYVQLARAQGDGWTLRIPLTTAPRHTRTDEITSRHAQGQPLYLLRDPGHRFSLDLTLRVVGSVASDTHKLDVEQDQDGMRVRLKDGVVIPDRDCVLSWRPPAEQDRPSLQVLLHDDSASGLVYFLALVAPPAVHQAGQGVRREITLLVDHSGSMSGAKWEASDWAVETFLSDLTERDAFALGLFHTTTRWFTEKLRPADAQTVERAIRFLMESKDSGGTNLGVALEQALGISVAKDERARHLLVVTDAQVTDAGRVLRLASEEARRKHRRRISVLCIDAAPNAFLANELAERGGGVARFLTSAPDEEDITTALDEVLADWAEPVLADLRLGVDRSPVEAAGREVLDDDRAGWGLVDLGDLACGRAIWVAGRIPRGEGGTLSFSARTRDGQEVAACRMDLAGERNERPALKALFGARRVLGLEFLINSGYDREALGEQLERLGYDPEEALAGRAGRRPRVYAENVRLDAQEALRGLLVREALDYGLASSETAFVAVRTEAGKPVEGTVAVANALAEGWSEGFVSRGLGAGTGLGLATPGLALRGGGRARLAMRRAGLAPSDLDIPAFLRRGPRRAEVGDRAAPEKAVAEPAPLFLGVPQFAHGEAVLFDSTRKEDAGKLPESGTISRLVVRFPGAALDHRGLDRGLSILIFVGDLSSPRARVRLADLLRRRGERPLNLFRRPGQVVRIVLVDPASAWARGAPEMSLGLRW